jgi:cell fate regulator YaaT (PSP1 superfamily)
MPIIVGIRFKRAGRIYYFDPGEMALRVDDFVVVETARGTEVGWVAIAPKQVLASELTDLLKPVLRHAEAADLLLQQHYRAKEAEVIERCREEVARHGLPMKLVGAEYNFDGSRLTFFFTAEGRVDFRELVKDLAVVFKTRIELRQIGARDEAKLHGGLGCCGRMLCCTTFLGDFASVSIRMAKDQDLPLNPMKISGLCGRLLCCLGYENEMYCAVKARLPKVGDAVVVPQGRGVVTGLNVLQETVTVELASSSETHPEVEVPAAAVRQDDAPAEAPSAAPARQDSRSLPELRSLPERRAGAAEGEGQAGPKAEAEAEEVSRRGVRQRRRR